MVRTVLVADADVNAQVIAETLLHLRGLDTRLTDDGADVCDLVRDEGIGIVILDLNLPGLNGFEVLRRLRGRSGVRFAPEPRILVVTDRQEPEIERFARRLGADAFMRKPLNPRRFIAMVEQLGNTAPQAA